MSLATNVANLATRVATEIKSVRTLVNGNAADLTALTTTAKGNLVAALNELKSDVDAAANSGGASINDATTSTASVWSSTKTNTEIGSQSSAAAAALISDAATATTTVWSSTKTDSEISTRVSGLVDSAPAALDTLNELAAALGDDPNFATTTTTALGNRVRFDAAQTLTAGQQTQARSNIGAASAADVGDTTTDFVATFEAGL